jgi:hypothetical protein
MNKMNTVERFYRNPEGKIIFNAIRSVGVEGIYECKHLHGYTDSSFPDTQITKVISDSIWKAFSNVQN